MTEHSRLYEIVSAVYEDHKDLGSISPSWLATEAIVRIDFPRSLHEVGYVGCHLQMRQIARGFCRQRFDPTETHEDDLFHGMLQQRYPAAHSVDEEPVYLLLETLSDTDVAYNVARLRKEADAKLRHADALEAWGRRRKRGA